MPRRKKPGKPLAESQLFMGGGGGGRSSGRISAGRAARARAIEKNIQSGKRKAVKKLKEIERGHEKKQDKISKKRGEIEYKYFDVSRPERGDAPYDYKYRPTNKKIKKEDWFKTHPEPKTRRDRAKYRLQYRKDMKKAESLDKKSSKHSKLAQKARERRKALKGK